LQEILLSLYLSRWGNKLILQSSFCKVQTKADWGVLQRIDNDKRLVKQAPTVLHNEALIVWIVEAAVRC